MPLKAAVLVGLVVTPLAVLSGCSNSDGLDDSIVQDDPTEEVDTDGDGVSDSMEDELGTDANNTDTDGDGVADNLDQFPNDASASVDSDGDGVSDDRDQFPNDPTETSDLNNDGLGDNANPFSGTVIGGTVTDQGTDAPISNANVSLELVDASTGTNPVLLTSTDTEGTFTLIAEDRLLPDSFVIVVTAPGYQPSATSLTTSDVDLQAVLALPVQSDEFIVVEPAPGVHHLGDGVFSGSVNSQFQRTTEGPTLARNFNLTADQAAAQSLTLYWLAKGIQNSNTISINGTVVGVTPNTNTDGSYTEQEIELATDGVLIEGANEVHIDSVLTGLNASDIDDFEFVILGFGAN